MEPRVGRPWEGISGKNGHRPVLHETSIKKHETIPASAGLALARTVHDLLGRVRSYGGMEDILGLRRIAAQADASHEELASLLGVARKLSQSLDLHQIATCVVHAATETFGASMAWVGRADQDGTIHVLSQFPEQFVGWPPSPLVLGDSTPSGPGRLHAFRSGDPVVIHHLQDETDPPLWAIVNSDQATFRCTAAFPLIALDRICGVLVLFSEQSGFFTPAKIDFLRGFAHFAAAALENARLFTEVEHRLREEESIRDIDMAISGSTDLRLTLGLFLEKALPLLGFDAGDILLFNRHTQMLEHGGGRGFRRAGMAHASLRIGEDFAGRAAMEGRSIYLPDLREVGTKFYRGPLLQGEDFVTYYAVPLVGKGQVTGVLEIFKRASFEPEREWLILLETVAGRAGVAIDNAMLLLDLRRAHRDVTIAYDATLEGWSRAMDMREKETEGHNQRVADVTVQVARAMGLGDEEIVHIRRGALLHDIGKIAIPDSILQKSGALTDEEWDVMRRHPVYAYELLSPIPFLRQALDIPYCHHEKWDGSGYPRGLRAEQIPIAARIFAVVDVWDALRSNRSYRKAWNEEQIRVYLREEAYAHFDPKVVEVFLTLLTQIG